jgi:hypothetical protein
MGFNLTEEFVEIQTKQRTLPVMAEVFVESFSPAREKLVHICS